MKIKLELKLTDRKDGSKMMKRGLAGWMCLALLGTLVCVPGKETAKAASQVTVASLDYAYSGTAGDKDATVQWTKGTTPYFEVQLSTKGYKNLSFSAYVGASKKRSKGLCAVLCSGKQYFFYEIEWQQCSGTSDIQEKNDTDSRNSAGGNSR